MSLFHVPKSFNEIINFQLITNLKKNIKNKLFEILQAYVTP